MSLLLQRGAVLLPVAIPGALFLVSGLVLRHGRHVGTEGPEAAGR